MHYAVKTLLEQGKSVSGISRELNIDRKTVRKLRDKVRDGVNVPVIIKSSILDPWKDRIVSLMEEGLSGVLIHSRLKQEYQADISYSCVKKYIRKLKVPDGPYVPLISPPGYEAQVDFGYAGVFFDGATGKKCKVWVFCMRLSNSRYDYYELVKQQDIATFIRCHINAFEFFGGAPATVKLDNLKAGVLTANIYEPVFQKEYANMLYHYGSSPIACRIRYPQEKGKVESSVKYVKNNFIKGLKTRELSYAHRELNLWRDNNCNNRIHGSTKKIPYEQYVKIEKDKLRPLPESRYEVFHIEERRVNKYGHITFKNNYYSIPHRYISELVTVKSNGKLIKIYNEDMDEIAIHQLYDGVGEFITNSSHNPVLKNSMMEKDYISKASSIGLNAYNFFLNLRIGKPDSYHRIMKGVFALSNKYGSDVVDAACRRANEFSAFSYLSIKKICEDGLYDSPEAPVESVVCSGYGNDLRMYDSFVNRCKI